MKTTPKEVALDGVEEEARSAEADLGPMNTKARMCRALGLMGGVGIPLEKLKAKWPVRTPIARLAGWLLAWLRDVAPERWGDLKRERVETWASAIVPPAYDDGWTLLLVKEMGEVAESARETLRKGALEEQNRKALAADLANVIGLLVAWLEMIETETRFRGLG